MIDLCGEWRFRPEGGDETTIVVPSFWEAAGHLTLDGRATYERDVSVAAGSPFATLEFGAVADLCDVFWNDEHVGSHEVGFTPFSIDLSGRVRAENVLRVEVTDPTRDDPDFMRTPQGKQGWGNIPFPSPPSVYITYGGIWQPCRLVPHGPAYVTDVWCDMDPDEPKITIEVRGECDEVEVRAFGEVVRGPAGSFTFKSAELWSPSRPTLHEIDATAFSAGAPSHSRVLRTGLRRIERSGDDLLINGAPYRMRSALHQGFWPRGLYAADGDLIDRDIDLALGAGLNTLRTHLKAFEPRWLDAADRKGLYVHADLPLAEPLRDASILLDDVFVRRCLIAATEQVRRDRSRPSIIVWTLLNEVGLMAPDMLRTDEYRSLVTNLDAAVRELDPNRPIVENDWIFDPDLLVSNDVRTAHWYGRTTNTFLADVDERLEATSKKSGPFYVSEFGEWGLPSPEPDKAFWSQDDDLEALVTASGWRGTYDDFTGATQRAQGWADRIQAERFRTRGHVQGFCLTEWTDVPHELNGLVSLRRNPKEAIETFRPSLADVAPIAVLDRYAYTAGETMRIHLFVSNWSSSDLEPDTLTVNEHGVEVPSVAAGSVVELGEVELPAAPIELRYRDVTATYGVHVSARQQSPIDVAVGLREIPDSRPAVVIEPEALPDGWPFLEDVPTTWGPTPVPFTTTGLRAFPEDHVLSHEVFGCYPAKVVGGVQGAINLFVAPPIGRYGALVYERDGLVVCTLRLADAIERGDLFALSLLGDLADLAAG